MDNLSIRITDHNTGSDQTIHIDRQPSKQSCAVLVEGEATAREVAAVMARPARTPALEWSDTLCNGERVDHAAAEKAAAEWGGRLPTRAKLLSLVDDTRCDPAIDTDRLPDTKSAAYWTSTELASDSSYAWIVDFYGGGADFYRRDYDDAFVRAVRSVPAGQ